MPQRDKQKPWWLLHTGFHAESRINPTWNWGKGDHIFLGVASKPWDLNQILKTPSYRTFVSKMKMNVGFSGNPEDLK